MRKVYKIIFTLIFLLLALSISIFPWAKENIDNKVLFLIIFSLMPWFNIRTLEIFGFGKVELVSKEEKEQTEKIIDNIKEDKFKNIKNLETDIISMINLIPEPRFKLVAIRVELERFLNEIAEKHNIKRQIPNKNLAQLLFDDQIIGKNDYELIRVLWPILNRAVHSDIQKIDFSEMIWAITTGTFLLERIELISKEADNR